MADLPTCKAGAGEAGDGKVARAAVPGEFGPGPGPNFPELRISRLWAGICHRICHRRVQKLRKT